MALSRKQARRKAEKFVDRYTLEEYLQRTQDELKMYYGVENLSVIEKWHLKNTLLKCLEESKFNHTERFFGKLGWIAIFTFPQEAAERWLLDLYGTNINAQYADESFWPNDPERKNMKMCLSGKAMQRLKEDIQFIREKAHMPYLY